MHGLLGRLDPWAALLLGVLITLALVILLATPGPWQKVVPIAPAARNPLPPEDIAVFVQGGANGACNGVVWVHVDHRRQSLTATVLPPQTEARVAGGGHLPLHRIVDDIGPKVAAGSLGDVLDVDMETWLTVDDEALRLAVSPMYRGNEEKPRLRLYMAAAQAWEGKRLRDDQWALQAATLEAALPQVPFGSLNLVTFANYVLGFGVVQNELDLQSTTALGQSLKRLRPSQIRVRALPVRVEECGTGEVWRIQERPLHDLRHALAVGLMPPESEAKREKHSRALRVLLVQAPGADSTVYVAEVRRLLQRSAGVKVDVRSVTAQHERMADRVEEMVARWQPLVVIVPAQTAASGTAALDPAIEELCDALARAWTPVVIGLPSGLRSFGALPAEVAQAAATLEEAGAVVSFTPSTDAQAGGESRLARLAAGADVATTVRMAWQKSLSPDLPSTRLGHHYGAARATTVAVAGGSQRQVEAAAAVLRSWGYTTSKLSADRRLPETARTSVLYMPGRRRAALALAGDLGLRRDRVALIEAGPAALTLVLREEVPRASPDRVPAVNPGVSAARRR